MFLQKKMGTIHPMTQHDLLENPKQTQQCIRLKSCCCSSI